MASYLTFLRQDSFLPFTSTSRSRASQVPMVVKPVPVPWPRGHKSRTTGGRSGFQSTPESGTPGAPPGRLTP